MKKVHTLFLTLAAITGFAGNAFAQSNAGSLPVVLVSFSANLITHKKVALTWTTQQQINTDCFDVEKSSDGLSWIAIATVQSTGNSAIPVTYNAADNCPIKGANFYRVKIKSLDGLVGFTIAKTVWMNVITSVSIYPNPATNLVTVSLGEVPQADYWYLSVINSMGQVLQQKKYNKNATTVNLSVGSYLNGNYTLSITAGKYTQSKKIMINHN